MVFSACLRQTGDDAIAEETAQAVFMLLAEKAHGLSRSVVLSGWLYQTARLASSNARRMEARRRKHEREASRVNHEPLPEQPQGRTAWEKMAPRIDAAMAALPAADRDAILLRYFERQSNRDVGRRLGLSEDAAEKRVARALERLRGVLRNMGVDTPADMLAVALPLAVSPAPAALLGNLAVIGKVGAVKGAGWAFSQEIMREVGRAMFRAKLKFAALVCAGVLALGGVGTYLVHAGETTPVKTEAAQGKEETPAAPQVPVASHGKRIQVNVLEEHVIGGDRNGESWVEIGSKNGADFRTTPNPYEPFEAGSRAFTSIKLRALMSNEQQPSFAFSNLSGPAANSQVLLSLKTMVNSDDMDGGPVNIERDGRVFKVVFHEWRTPMVPKDHNVALLRYHVVSLGVLEAGEYEVRVERRTFAANERGWPVQRFSLSLVEEGITKFTVEKDKGGKAFKGELVWQKKDLPAEAQGVLWQEPEQMAFKVAPDKANGVPQLGLRVGTFDFKKWSARAPASFKDMPTLANPKPGDPLYALVLGPELNQGESMTLQDVRWEGNRAKIRVNLWRDHGERSKNFVFYPALLVPLYLTGNGQAAQKAPAKGDFTVELEWQTLWAPSPGGMYEPSDEKNAEPFKSMNHEAALKME